MNIPHEEHITDPCDEMARLAKMFLPIENWEFEEKYRSVKDERLIYDSQWCRVKFIWSGWDMQIGNSMNIYYGRLHAPNDHERMIWNGEECYCWHGLTSREILNFLDGISPQEAASQKGLPKIIDEFRKSELWKSMAGKRHQPELTVRMNAAIWEHYDVRLFEMFDLQHPELWEKYRQFLKAVYDIKGRPDFIKPSMDKVC
jgi:hypothetical protein